MISSQFKNSFLLSTHDHICNYLITLGAISKSKRKQVQVQPLSTDISNNHFKSFSDQLCMDFLQINVITPNTHHCAAQYLLSVLLLIFIVTCICVSFSDKLRQSSCVCTERSVNNKCIISNTFIKKFEMILIQILIQ